MPWVVKCCKDVLYAPHHDSNLLSVVNFLKKDIHLLLRMSCAIYSDSIKKQLLFEVPMAKILYFFLFGVMENIMLSKHY